MPQPEKREPVLADPASTPTDRRARREQLVQERRRDRVTIKERKQRQRLVNLAAIGGTVVVVLLIVGLLGRNWWMGREGAAALEQVTMYEYTAAQHQNGELTYTEQPPVGGPHNAAWQTCGYYAAPVPNWHAVHSLEHGAVWITYNPDLPQDQIDELRERAEEQSYILVSPYPGLSSPVVASFWNHQLALDSADDPGLDAFIEEYRLNTELTPEPGASCTGGNTGTLSF
ncbi:MAG TPA: DUF3105 domain-containing protein [Thermomicrobiales bacterium]|jgi:hypothetical protein|nr:DUF3105 domain-containing protein [Thermomicrobiales bacterium]